MPEQSHNPETPPSQLQSSGESSTKSLRDRRIKPETAAEASMKQFEGVLNDVTAVPWRSDAVPRERT
jgi:hypothetical protein